MRRRALIVLVPLLALTAACTGENGRRGGGDGSDEDVGSARGGEGRPCLLDADCAAGFGCVIGVCTAGCTSDSECDGEICDPHGYCGGPRTSSPGPLMSAEPEIEAPVAPIDPGESTSIVVHNPGADPLVARLAFSSDAAVVDPTVFVVDPHGSAELPLEVVADTGSAETVGALWTEHGSYPVPVSITTDPTGRWRGQISYDDGRPLGRTGLELELDFDAGGDVLGRALAAGGVMWPTDVRAEGTWDANAERFSIELHDVIPARAADEGGAESPLGREIERRVFLDGAFVDDGRAIEGQVRERLEGLRATPVLVRGTFRIARTGPLPGPLQVPPAVGSAQAPEPWLGALTDACDGVGHQFATAAQTGNPDFDQCEPCGETQCSDFLTGACTLGLVEHGYQFEKEIQLGELSVTVSDPFATPGGWDVCFDAAAQNYPCLDDRSLACAAQIMRTQHDLAPTPDKAKWLLDVIERELTAATLIGTGHMVDAGLAYTENTPLDVAQAELSSLELADDELRSPLQHALAPELLDVYDQLGSSVLRDEREGRDLSASLAVAARRAEVARASLRLRRRMHPGQVAQLRAEAGWQAVWYHAWGALLSDLFDGYSVTDEMGELAVFDETVSDFDGLWRELGPTNNPLGFSPRHVPILLSSQSAMGTETNYDLLAAHARDGVAHFEKSVGRAKAAVDEYEQNAYDAEARASAVRDEFDAQLVSLCGADPLDPTRPQLETCGASSGELYSLQQRIEAATIVVKKAHAASEANFQAIEVERERMARRIENAAELEITLDGLEEQLMVIVTDDAHRRRALAGARARAECSAMKKTNAAESAGKMLAAAARSASVFGAITQTDVPAAAAEVAAAAVATDIRCNHRLEEAGFEKRDILGTAFTQVNSMIVNSEIDAAVRASHINDQVIDHEANIKRLGLNNEQLALDIEGAEQELEIAATQLANGFELAASILARRERALKRLTFDPKNPFLNPSFLLVRNELGRRLASDREQTLRKSYRAARALEYEINRELPLIESSLFPSRAPTELEDVNICLDEIHVRHQLAYGSPQQHVTELSLRRDIFGIEGPVADPAGGGDVSEAQQFQAVLTQPAHMLPDGSIEITLTLPIEGDGAQVSEVLCNDRIESLQVEAVGDFLGDEQMVVLIGRKGGSHVRRCEAASLPADERITTYNLDERRVAIQAGVNDWGSAPPNAGLAGWPVAGDQWVFTIPAGTVSPENADADFTRLTDFLLRITHRAGTVAEEGSVQFTPTCG